ncbi:XRE family transcriptional regulator [Adlercreutzia equolifaciens]|uniref:XRE family transcriptional regulator n=1 Tax=Adlercreutzia equolifaciens TaxID=446660 RepID=UPI0023B02048|nr:XRE family transcriptional regulator [Adlercreutzia equolifaciens]MDE8702621.1 XRE family transcriptional regulator [Adlercreutzia equolifaciens]
MEEPLTEDMLAELLDAPDLSSFIDRPEVGNRTVAEYLAFLLEAKGLKRSVVVRDAGINETYGYQIFKGQRPNVDRNYLLKLAFAMGLSRVETNRLLRAGGVSELYAKNRRDAIIVFALQNGYSLQRADEELYRFNEETIG